MSFILQHRAVDFLQYRIVHFPTKGGFNRFDVWPMAVSRNLYAIFQARRKIANEVNGGASVALPKFPDWNQFRVGINRSPKPNIASVGMCFCNRFCPVAFFTKNPAPHLVKQQTTAFEILELFGLEIGATPAALDQYAHDGFHGNAS